MAHANLEALREVSGDLVIIRVLRPSRSVYLTPCDSYLWGNLKYKLYKKSPHSGRTNKHPSGALMNIQEELKS
jgi:hypothetical protein